MACDTRGIGRDARVGAGDAPKPVQSKAIRCQIQSRGGRKSV